MWLVLFSWLWPGCKRRNPLMPAFSLPPATVMSAGLVSLAYLLSPTANITVLKAERFVMETQSLTNTISKCFLFSLDYWSFNYLLYLPKQLLARAALNFHSQG